MVTDNIADLLTRVRNAGLAGHRTAQVPVSKLNKSLLEIFLSEGYIASFDEKKTEEEKFPHFDVELKYFDNGKPLMSALKRVSKPGCRVYSAVDKLHKHRSGLGSAILSTSKGLMTDREAKRQNIGGEVLALIG